MYMLHVSVLGISSFHDCNFVTAATLRFSDTGSTGQTGEW